MQDDQHRRRPKWSSAKFLNLAAEWLRSYSIKFAAIVIIGLVLYLIDYLIAGHSTWLRGLQESLYNSATQLNPLNLASFLFNDFMQELLKPFSSAIDAILSVQDYVNGGLSVLLNYVLGLIGELPPALGLVARVVVTYALSPFVLVITLFFFIPVFLLVVLVEVVAFCPTNLCVL
jgi:hypothetical protein